jgi:hypothetical protein
MMGSRCFCFCRGLALRFFLQGRIGVMADHRHHGEGEHHQGHVAMPATPGSSLIVIGLLHPSTTHARPAQAHTTRVVSAPYVWPRNTRFLRLVQQRKRRSTNVPRRRPYAGESQMAVTAIDHGDRVVTVTSQLAETASSDNSSQSRAFTTSVYDGPLNASMWRAKSWSASLRNHAAAVNHVIKLIASNADPTG